MHDCVSHIFLNSSPVIILTLAGIKAGRVEIARAEAAHQQQYQQNLLQQPPSHGMTKRKQTQCAYMCRTCTCTHIVHCMGIYTQLKIYRLLEGAFAFDGFMLRYILLAWYAKVLFMYPSI